MKPETIQLIVVVIGAAVVCMVAVAAYIKFISICDEFMCLASDIVVAINRFHLSDPVIAGVFPKLEECFEYVRTGMADQKLTPQDEHCIGSVWAYIEGAVLPNKN